MSARDKRRYERVKARNVSAHLNVANQSSPCVIQNISAGGIFIETAEALPVGMPVAVNLAQPGWNRALRISGRVVWALAGQTAKRKGSPPGMRIKFDPLPPSTASDLMRLLQELGAPNSPRPELTAEEHRVPREQNPVPSFGALQLTAQVSPAPKPPPARAPTNPGTVRLSGAAKPSAPPPPPAKSPGAPTEAPRLIVQVQGLLMQLGELQGQLEHREQELSELREKLKDKEAQLDKADRERKAAELAIQRLSMQLSSRR